MPLNQALKGKEYQPIDFTVERDRVARFCDDETARFVDAFTRIFEPVLMAGIGVAVGLIVVLMYMPIFELAGNLR